VPTERERRLALNEAAFRIANDRMRAWEEREGPDPASYLCECADPDCRERIMLRIHEYEAVRAESRRFVIVPGHEVPDVETVVDREDGYFVIEKDPETDAISKGTDPRC
jgi:hypothetical protein